MSAAGVVSVGPKHAGGVLGFFRTTYRRGWGGEAEAACQVSHSGRCMYTVRHGGHFSTGPREDGHRWSQRLMHIRG